jgi:hypothetical protein
MRLVTRHGTRDPPIERPVAGHENRAAREGAPLFHYSKRHFL